MKIIAVSNQKGGVAKTTTVVNVATVCAALGKKVLIVDLDPQGNASSGLNIPLLDKSSFFDKVVIKSTAVSNLDILPAADDLATIDIELGRQDKKEFILKKTLQTLNYDYIFLDTGPALNLLTVNALTAATHLLVPMQSEYYALEGLSKLMAITKAVKRNFNPKLNLMGFLLTMHDRRSKLCQQVEQDLRKYFGDKVFKTIIPRNVKIAEAPSFGKPIMLYDHKSIGAKAYMDFVVEMLQEEKDLAS